MNTAARKCNQEQASPSRSFHNWQDKFKCLPPEGAHQRKWSWGPPWCSYQCREGSRISQDLWPHPVTTVPSWIWPPSRTPEQPRIMKKKRHILIIRYGWVCMYMYVWHFRRHLLCHPDPTILSWRRVISTDGNQYSWAFALSLATLPVYLLSLVTIRAYKDQQYVRRMPAMIAQLTWMIYLGQSRARAHHALQPRIMKLMKMLSRLMLW